MLEAFLRKLYSYNTDQYTLQVKYRTCCSSRRIWQGSAAIFGRLDSAGRWLGAIRILPTTQFTQTDDCSIEAIATIDLTTILTY